MPLVVQPYPRLTDHQFTFRDGAPERDIHAHLISREALWGLLIGDPPPLFHTFEDLGKIATLLAQLSDTFARECGWRDRAHMYAEPTLHDAARSPHYDSFAAHVAEFPWDRLSTFRGAAEHLVHDTWGLPREHARERWAWLVADLQRLFVLSLEAHLTGHANAVCLYTWRGPSPTIEVSFQTRANESADEARQRLKQLYEESAAALGPTPERDHRGTILDEAGHQRDVAWFYRHVISGESIGVLARAYVEDRAAHGIALSPDQRKIVRDGIKRARHLLSEIPA